MTGGTGRFVVRRGSRGVLVGGILRRGPAEADFHCHIELVDFVDLAEGLETIGDDLKCDGVAEGDDLDEGFAILVGFKFEGSLILVALDGMKDDVSVCNRLAVVVADDSDFNPRSGWRDFVFAPVVGVVLLGANVEAACDEAKRNKNCAERKR